MSILGWVTDRIILEPTRHSIVVPDVERERVPFGGGYLEVWIHRFGPCAAGGAGAVPDFYVLKFPGTASRAENSTALVENCWPQDCIEVWAVNPPGYGGSSGKASLRHIPDMASAALAALKKVSGNKPVLVAGGSLGSVSALYLAANESVDAVMVQNPPALRQVIQGQNRWWHVGWMTKKIAGQVPDALDSILNAGRATAPAVFSVAEKDHIVPARFQQRIIDAYAGPKHVAYRPDADHDTPLSEPEMDELRSLATWLQEAGLRTHTG